VTVLDKIRGGRFGAARRSIIECAAWIAGAVAIAAACSACAGSVANILPVALGGTALAGSTLKPEPDEKNAQSQHDEEMDRCESMTRAAPGIEEVRKNKQGVIESRQWRLNETSNGPAWMVVRGKSAPPDGWEPKPNIESLKFSPPLANSLEVGEPAFLIYAPEMPMSIKENEQAANLNGAFASGEGHGTFKWRQRSYAFELVKKLPCYPVPK